MFRLVPLIAIFYIGGSITVAFLHGGLVALWYLVHTPTGDILSRRVEGQHVIQVLMVKLAMNLLLDMLEVAHHAVGVEFFCLAKHLNMPVMAVKVLAFAGIGELQAMAGGNLYLLRYVIHILQFSFHISFLITFHNILNHLRRLLSPCKPEDNCEQDADDDADECALGLRK